MARVTAIFKKGDSAQCANYRPISLLNLGYKVFAALVLNRLKDGNVDEYIWPTQFGFKTGCGTAEALFLARRVIDRAWMVNSGETVMLALDWAKAFDSISPAALRVCLQVDKLALSHPTRAACCRIHPLHRFRHSQ